MAGLFGLVFIVMFESITVNNESEYYVLKEAMEASMLESVDLACFRDGTANGCNGSLKISEQKFVENFTRRFAASVSGDVSEYNIKFYDIIESPPKASVVVTGVTQKFFIFNSKQSDSFELVNDLSGILEAKDWNYFLLNNDTNVASSSSSDGTNNS